MSGKNTALQEVLGTGKYPHVEVLPFYELTRPRWRWHFGNCTHRPNGWKKYAGPPLKLRTARRDDRARLVVCDSRSGPRMRDQGDLLRLHALVLLADDVERARARHHVRPVAARAELVGSRKSLQPVTSA